MTLKATWSPLTEDDKHIAEEYGHSLQESEDWLCSYNFYTQIEYITKQLAENLTDTFEQATGINTGQNQKNAMHFLEDAIEDFFIDTTRKIKYVPRDDEDEQDIAIASRATLEKLGVKLD